MKAWTPPTAAEVEHAIQDMARRIVDGFHPEKISGQFGRWAFEIVHKPEDIRPLLDRV